MVLGRSALDTYVMDDGSYATHESLVAIQNGPMLSRIAEFEWVQAIRKLLR
jgi:hypothetical protein